MADSYQCEVCGGVFEKTRSDEQAMEEAIQLFNPEELQTGCGIICHDCWHEFWIWMAFNSNGASRTIKTIIGRA